MYLMSDNPAWIMIFGRSQQAVSQSPAKSSSETLPQLALFPASFM